MSSASPTSSTVTLAVLLGSTRVKLTSLRCSTCKLNVMPPEATSSVDNAQMCRCGGALAGIVTFRTKLATEFGVPMSTTEVELMLAPSVSKLHVLGSEAKAVLFHCIVPLLGSSASTV